MHSAGLFDKLNKLAKESERIVKLLKEENILLFHATEKRGYIFPLSESQFVNSFFVCTEKEKFAVKIMADRSPNVSVYRNTVKFKMPVSLFKKLFIEDKSEGQPGDELSIEAYEHSYFLPVSRFPLFNYYFNKGLIGIL